MCGFRQGYICPVKFQLDQIQNGRLLAIINFDLPYIWESMPDTCTYLDLYQKTKCAVLWRDMPWNVKLIKLEAIIYFISVIAGKMCQIDR